MCEIIWLLAMTYNITKNYLRSIIVFCGSRARVVLPCGVVAAFFLPETGGFLKPSAPYILCLLVAMAMVRFDMVAVLRQAMRPQRMFHNLCITLLLLVVVP